LPPSPAAGEGEGQGEGKSDDWQVFGHACDHA
jgi:hypothetical protein